MVKTSGCFSFQLHCAPPFFAVTANAASGHLKSCGMHGGYGAGFAVQISGIRRESSHVKYCIEIRRDGEHWKVRIQLSRASSCFGIVLPI